MRDLLGKLALPFVGAVLFGSCSPSTGSSVLPYGGGSGPTGGTATGGYTGNDPGTGGIYMPTGGYPGTTGGSTYQTGTGGFPGAGGGIFPTGGILNTGGVTSVGTGGTRPTGGTTSVATGGVTSVATGGTRPTGGTTSSSTGGKDTTGTGGEEIPTDGPFTVNNAGYITSGVIKGYAWSSGDDITPEDFSELEAGGDLCVSGTVPETDDWSGTGILGINLNQPKTGSTDGDPFDPTGSGIKISITNAGGSPLRLQVKAGSTEYCTKLTGSGGSFDWSEFTVGCWESGGKAYSPSTSITAIMVLVPGPGTGEGDVDYEFCITDLAEVP